MAHQHVELPRERTTERVQTSGRPRCDDRRRLRAGAEAMLRDLAFVLHCTERVAKEIRSESVCGVLTPA